MLKVRDLKAIARGADFRVETSDLDVVPRRRSASGQNRPRRPTVGST